MTCPKCEERIYRTPSTFPYWLCPRHGQVIPEPEPYSPACEKPSCDACPILNSQADEIACVKGQCNQLRSELMSLRGDNRRAANSYHLNPQHWKEKFETANKLYHELLDDCQRFFTTKLAGLV